MKEWLQGKKTYIIVACVFVIGGLQAAGVEIPIWVYPLLGSLGLGAVGAKIDRAAK